MIRNIKQDNSEESLKQWVLDLVEQSQLSVIKKECAKAIGFRVIREGRWRGDISEQLVKQGFTNEEFNFELYL